MITDFQVRILMKQRHKGISLGISSSRSAMSENTARKYLRSGVLPSESKAPHTWRTRRDPFADVSGDISSLLGVDGSLQAKTIFEHFQREYPGRFSDGQLRS